MDYGFRMPNEIDMRINELKETKNVLTKLKGINKINDLETLDNFIKRKKENPTLKAETFLYGCEQDNFLYYTPITFQQKVNEVLNINNYDISGGNKSSVNGFEAIYDYDYRISLQNSDKIKDSDIIEFINAFNVKSKNVNLKYGIKIKPNEQDLIIIYLTKDDLEKIISILEDLKTNDITKKFGKRKPFTVGLDDKSYYGISMGSTKTQTTSRFKNNMMSKRIEMGKTMTEYSGYLIDKAYESLLNKYNNIEKINAEELYQEMHNIHNMYYNFNKEDNVPLWMNENIKRSMR